MAYNPFRKITHDGKVFVARAVKEIVRRTGRARRNWAKYLSGKLASGERFEFLLRFLSPAEIRARVSQLPVGWSSAQAMWEHLVDRLGVAAALALGDGVKENALSLMA